MAPIPHHMCRVHPAIWSTGLAVLISAACVLNAGCSSLGPRVVPGDGFNYNEAGLDTAKQQMLLNLVRLRYGEPIYFVEILSMISQYHLQASGSLYGWKNDLHGNLGPWLRTIPYGTDGSPSREDGWGASLSYSDQPTITYTPLHGDEFAQRVMAPISPLVILYLTQAGWSIDRLMECCVQSINGIENRMTDDTGSGAAEKGGSFRRVAALFKELQNDGCIRFGTEIEDGIPLLYVYPPALAGCQPQLEELRHLLGITEPFEKLRIVTSSSPARPGELAIVPRSLLATMYELSNAVAAPEDHSRSGEVAAAPTNEQAERWLAIRNSRVPRQDAHVQVFSNGYWFYVSKADWTSKRTFALLNYLFSMQSAGTLKGVPVLTVQAGR